MAQNNTPQPPPTHIHNKLMIRKTNSRCSIDLLSFYCIFKSCLIQTVPFDSSSPFVLFTYPYWKYQLPLFLIYRKQASRPKHHSLSLPRLASTSGTPPPCILQTTRGESTCHIHVMWPSSFLFSLCFASWCIPSKNNNACSSLDKEVKLQAMNAQRCHISQT